MQQQYAADRGLYAARKTRDVTLVTVLNQAAANALAAKVKGGAAIGEAARAAGLETRTVSGADQSTLAASTSDAFAAAAFGAGKGATVGPVRGTLGYVVGRVDAAGEVAGKSLAQARRSSRLTTQKTNTAIQKIRDAIEDSLADNANLNEVATDQKLTAQATPALLANGTKPEAPAATPDPLMVAVAQAGLRGGGGRYADHGPAGAGRGRAGRQLRRRRARPHRRGRPARWRRCASAWSPTSSPIAAAARRAVSPMRCWRRCGRAPRSPMRSARPASGRPRRSRCPRRDRSSTRRRSPTRCSRSSSPRVRGRRRRWRRRPATAGRSCRCSA
ncbi:peptidyl-prolyl cis-trans isomerase [Sphingomonas sp. MMS24-JH45]